MHEEIIAYLRRHGAASSVDVAREFLKFKNPDQKLAHVAVRGILGRDRRFLLGEDNLWRAAAQSERLAASQPLADVPWAAVYFLALPADPTVPAQVSLWTAVEPPQLLFERWLIDPASLSWEEQQTLASVSDAPFSDETRAEKAARLLSACEGKTLLFLSWRQQALFSNLVAQAGFSPPDDAILVSSLFLCCKRPAPRPLSLDECHKSVFGSSAPECYAYKRGERFALCCSALFDDMAGRGITNVSQIEDAEQEELVEFDFSSKAFTRQDIAASAGNLRRLRVQGNR